MSDRARKPPLTLYERLWRRVEKTETCWNWVGCRDRRGYGLIGYTGSGRKVEWTHRASWILAHGPIPDGLCVCHHCDNPSCVRPSHLFLGTQADNNRDAMRKGRTQRGHTHHNAKLNPEAVREIRRRYNEGGVFQRELGAEFGVTQTVIGTILRGEAWAHVK
jgi:hypothetical protein